MNTKSISIRREIYEELLKIQTELAISVGFKVSVADAIQYLINHYQRTK